MVCLMLGGGHMGQSAPKKLNPLKNPAASFVYHCPLFISLLLILPHIVHSQTCPSWAVVGDATLSSSGTSVTLTTAIAAQSGACWSTTPIDLTQNFTLTFNAYFGAAGGADGIDFVLQDDPRTISSLSGNGVTCGACRGYSGYDAIAPSMAFSIATYNTNGVLSPMENGVTTNTCLYTSVPASCPYTFTSSIQNSAAHAVTITWNAASKALTFIIVDSNTTPQTMVYIRDLVANVFGGQTKVYYGFTGATGASSSLQYVTDGTCTPPASTPTCSAPQTSGLTSVGTSGTKSCIGLQDGTLYAFSNSATVTSMDLYLSTATAVTGILGIYANNGTAPGNLIVQSRQVAMAAGWNSVAVPPAGLPAGSYWLEFYLTGTTGTVPYNGSASEYYETINNGPYNSLQMPYTVNGTGQATGTDGFSIYAVSCQGTVPAWTSTFTWTPTFTSTSTPTLTPTSTRTSTSTLTSTRTRTPTRTPTLTRTPTSTATPTNSATASQTPTSSSTSTGTPTDTFTSTFTSTDTPTPTFQPVAVYTPTTGDICPFDVAVGGGYIAFNDGSIDGKISVYDSGANWLYDIQTTNSWLGGMDIDSSGELYVAEYGNGVVGYQLIPGHTPPGIEYSWSARGHFNLCSGVKINSAGNLVVADDTGIWVTTFKDDTGSNVIPFGPNNYPENLALDSAGNIYVSTWNTSNSGNAPVFEYNSSYNPVNSFYGAAWSEPLGPYCAGIVVDSLNNLYISDFENGRVVCATASGVYVGEIDGFPYLGDIALDVSGQLFVADYGGCAVDEYNTLAGVFPKTAKPDRIIGICTATVTATPTATPTPTPTSPLPTPAFTSTPTPSMTATPTASLTSTPTPTDSATPTMTNTVTMTLSPTLTLTPTCTSVPGVSVVAAPSLSQDGMPIQFRVVLKDSSAINLSLYSIIGELVYSAETAGSPGLNQLEWGLRNNSGSPVATGLYIYKVQAGNQVFSGKVAVIH